MSTEYDPGDLGNEYSLSPDQNVNLNLPSYIIPAEVDADEYNALVDTIAPTLCNAAKIRVAGNNIIIDHFSFLATFLEGKPHPKGNKGHISFPFYNPKPAFRVAMALAQAKTLKLQLERAIEAAEARNEQGAPNKGPAADS